MTADAIIRLVRVMQAGPRPRASCRNSSWNSASTSLFAGLSVRHAARHALLHHRQRMVAIRLRALLGPQRSPAYRALHQALRSSGPEGGKGERHILSHDQIEAVLMPSAGYHVRVFGAQGKIRGRRPADIVEFERLAIGCARRRRSAVSFAVEPQARQPLPAVARHRDVHRLSSLDRVARTRHDRARLIRQSSPLHSSRYWHPARWMGASDVVRAEDCNRHRSAAQAGRPPRLRRRRTHHRQFCDRNRIFASCCVRFSGSATRSFSSACCSTGKSAGSARSWTITRVSFQ